MSQSVLHVLLGVVPKKAKFITKERAFVATTLVAQLLALLVTRKPSLAPFQSFLSMLLGPSEIPPDTTQDDQALLRKIKALQAKLTAASDIEKPALRTQINVLTALLVDA